MAVHPGEGLAEARLGTLAADLDTASAALRSGRADQAREVLQRHCALLGAVQALPSLPDGLVFPDLSASLAKAQSLLQAQGATPHDLWAACRALLSSSPMTTLVKAASPVTGGDPALLAVVLGAGWWLGSAAFERWRAQVLGAPPSSAMLPFGAIGTAQMQSALAAAPRLRAAFETTGVVAPAAALAAIVLRDDAECRLWAQFGPEAPWAAFQERRDVAACLDECLRALLADYVALDITDEAVRSVMGLLDGAADPALRPRARLSGAEVARASAVTADANATPASRAAFHALVVLSGVARARKVNLPLALSEARP